MSGAGTLGFLALIVTFLLRASAGPAGTPRGHRRYQRIHFYHGFQKVSVHVCHRYPILKKHRSGIGEIVNTPGRAILTGIPARRHQARIFHLPEIAIDRALVVAA